MSVSIQNIPIPPVPIQCDQFHFVQAIMTKIESPLHHHGGEDIRGRISTVLLHHAAEYAEEAAALIAAQWNHKQREVDRNIKSMVEESKDNLPCHLALLLAETELLATEPKTVARTHPEIGRENGTENGEILRETGAENEARTETVIERKRVIGHLKLVRAASRGDGTACIMYSLVVHEEYRGEIHGGYSDTKPFGPTNIGDWSYRLTHVRASLWEVTGNDGKLRGH